MLRRAPQVLLGLLFLFLLGFVLTQADVHGRTFDEPLQNDYGHRVLDWYLSLGSDRGFLDYPEQTQLPQHGPVFETVVAVFQSGLHAVFGADPWTVRSLVCGLTGVLGIALMALCALEIARASRRIGPRGAWWLALASALTLALYPRWTGAIFTNSKDIPLAVAMLAVLWLTIRLARRWEEEPARLPRRDLVALGVVFGVAVSIRVIALLWVPVVGVLALLWLVLRSGRGAGAWRRVGLGAGVVALASYLTILAVWPYILLHPITGLPDAIGSMSKYPWDDPILFDGQKIEAMELPRDYVPTWLWQGSPWLSVLLALAGVVLVAVDLVRRRGSAADVALLGAFLLPVLALMALDPTLYNALRHFLFVVPPMLLLAAYALVVGIGALLTGRADARVHWRHGAAGAALAVVLAAQVQVLVGVARLYPLEYMYFNAATGGFAQQHTQFETDYWGACTRDAALWLEDHWRDHTSRSSATVQNRWGSDGQLAAYLPDELEILPEGKPDFGVYTLMDWRGDPWRKFSVVKEFEVDGVVLCQVKVNPDLS